MGMTDRIYQIHQLLENRRFVTREELPERLGPQYELPGLWFSAEEIHALLTVQHLLSNLDTGGLLGPHIQPLLSRLSGLLGCTADDSAEKVRKRIRIETVGAREFHLDNVHLKLPLVGEK